MCVDHIAWIPFSLIISVLYGFADHKAYYVTTPTLPLAILNIFPWISHILTVFDSEWRYVRPLCELLISLKVLPTMTWTGSMCTSEAVVQLE